LIEIGLGSLRQKIGIPEHIQHPGFLLLLCIRMERMRWRISKKRNLIGVSVQRGGFHPPQVGLRKEEVIAEYDGAKTLNRNCKLFIRIEGGSEPLDFGGKFCIDGFSRLSARLQLRPECANGSGGLVRLAEGDVEADHFGTAVAQYVQHFGEVCPRKGPAAQDFLRELVDIDNYDVRIWM